jgi:hypothetical protein
VQPISVFVFEPQEPLQICRVTRMPDTSCLFGNRGRYWPPTAHCLLPPIKRARRPPYDVAEGGPLGGSFDGRRRCAALASASTPFAISTGGTTEDQAEVGSWPVTAMGGDWPADLTWRWLWRAMR